MKKKTFGLLIIPIAAFCVYTMTQFKVPITDKPTYLTKAKWQNEFDLNWTEGDSLATWSETEETGGLGPFGDAWDQSIYYIGWEWSGLLDMWRATGEDKYIIELIGMAYNMMNKSVIIEEIGGGTYRGWPGWTENGSIYYPKGVPLWESYSFRFLCTMLRIMKDSPNFLAKNNGSLPGSTYQANYDYILNWIETNIWDKWVVDSVNNLYRSRTHMACHWARIAMELYYVTGETQYINVFNDISYCGMPCSSNYPGDNFRNQIKFNTSFPDAYTWSQRWIINDGNGIQDTDHAGDIIAWISEAYDLGYYWDISDINAFSRTFLDIVWINKDTNPIRLASNVDGAGSTAIFDLEDGGAKSYGWISLARWNGELFNTLNTYMDSRNDWKYLRAANTGAMALATAYQKGTVQYPEGASTRPPTDPPVVTTNSIR